MYEPKTAIEMEQKANKLLEILKLRTFSGQDNIKYLSSVLLEHYNDGFNDSIVVMGNLQ